LAVFAGIFPKVSGFANILGCFQDILSFRVFGVSGGGCCFLILFRDLFFLVFRAGGGAGDCRRAEGKFSPI
jgi:hypothetical protein